MDIQEKNEALFEEIYKKLSYLFARVDLKDREQKTDLIVDYLNRQRGLDERMRVKTKPQKS